MEPPRGFWPSLKSFMRFLPFFLGLLLLGVIKGVVMSPLICVIMGIGHSGIILGLWPAHGFWTYHCVIRAKQLGPVLKTLLCLGVTVLLFLWPFVGIFGSVLVGAAYGFLSPLVATFEAVGEGKTDPCIHCIIDGTWSTVKGSFTVVRDFLDVCFHSYFSIMDELSNQNPPDGQPYDIRLTSLPGAFIVGVLGVVVDVPVVLMLTLYKGPYMLFKGWQRLIHDLIGREGPFLETACVPCAGLAILLWPLAVVGAMLGGIISSLFLGAYAAIVAYQEASALFGLAYIVSSISIFDEYSNDMLDMSEGSCFPRLKYRKQPELLSGPLSRPSSLDSAKTEGRYPPSRTISLRDTVLETVKPLELLDQILVDCKQSGERLFLEGPISWRDVEDWKSNKAANQVIGVGLLAYSILQGLIRSANANTTGFLLNDNVTEITSTNRLKDTIFDWFYDPLMVLKEQIRALNLSKDEEDYLCRMVLLSSEPERMKDWSVGSPPQWEQRRAEIDAIARRLLGIARSISRFPTFRRRYECILNSLSDVLERSHTTMRSRSALSAMSSQKSDTSLPASINGSEV